MSMTTYTIERVTSKVCLQPQEREKALHPLGSSTGSTLLYIAALETDKLPCSLSQPSQAQSQQWGWEMGTIETEKARQWEINP